MSLITSSSIPSFVYPFLCLLVSQIISLIFLCLSKNLVSICDTKTWQFVFLSLDLILEWSVVPAIYLQMTWFVLLKANTLLWTLYLYHILFAYRRLAHLLVLGCCEQYYSTPDSDCISTTSALIMPVNEMTFKMWLSVMLILARVLE